MNYITTKLNNGRLGNQLFQLSATVATAKKYNYTPTLPEWEYNKYLLNPLPTSIITPTHFYREPYFNYTEIDLNESLTQIDTEDKAYNLEGFFQSEKYFADYKKEIRELFAPNYAMKAFVWKKIGAANVCSIHVRRGDYVGNNYYHQLDMNYYERAIWYIKEHAPVDCFLIFSDDIPWCKSQFIGDEFVFSEGNSDIEDLYLMSYCRNNIIANSSFSWWGSWLNMDPDKIVVAPTKDKWFGKSAGLNVYDLYLKNWITL